MNAPRQTLSYLQQLLKERNIQPKGQLGQNFLIDQNLLDLIVRSAEVSRDDAVLEVGSGTGTLTTRLADACGALVTVEIDPAFQQLTGELIAHHSHVTQYHGDVLRSKNEIAPEVLTALEEAVTRHGCRRRKLVANLPYVVATPVIGNLLVDTDSFEQFVVTVQWEIAERLQAAVGTSAYSSLAILVQSLADVQLIRKLAPSVFWPRPKVESAIVAIRPNAEKRRRIADPRAWRAFLRDLYTHRRKNLRGALIGWPSGRRDKTHVDAQLDELGIDGTLRAEALDIDEHLRLFAQFGQPTE